MRPITDRQAEVLETIQELTDELGYPPTVKELGDRLRLRSTCTTQRHLDALERKGYITRQPGQARTIRVLRWPKTEAKARCATSA